ncbi:hypothetical protein BC941DRAFT_217382 [Chlamydoabsidia padenii]|nr:hypothetical protein BC941DRAFT_217382 [Chlamydoabsidia padenii]
MVMNDLSLEDLDDTIQKHGYVKLKSESQPVNNSYWDPIPGQANITVSAQKAIRNSPCNSLVSMNPEQETNRRKLEDLFAKDMKTNLSYYLPANNTGNSPSRFEYLELDNPDAFKPNGSMLLLAQDWIPGNGSEITPPDLFAPLTDRGRPLFYRHKPSGTSDRSSSSQPVSAFSQSTVHLDSIATQPVPGAFAARPAKSKLSKKKKKKTTSGFM